MNIVSIDRDENGLLQVTSPDGVIESLTEAEMVLIKQSFWNLYQSIEIPPPAGYMQFKVTYWDRLSELFESVNVWAADEAMADDLFWNTDASSRTNEIEEIELADAPE